MFTLVHVKYHIDISTKRVYDLTVICRGRGDFLVELQVKRLPSQ